MRINIYSVSLLLILAFFSLLKAQQKTIAVQAARMIDVKTGSVINNVTVLIKNGRIVSVGSNLTVPQGTEIINLGDTTLLPGLIDAHTHLLMSLERNQLREEQNTLLFVSEMSTAKRALLGAAMAREMLEAGFTTVRDTGNSGINGDVALRDAINSGWLPGPRIFASTRALAPIGGQFGRMPNETQKIIDQEYVTINGADDARRAVRQALYDGADFIKVIALSLNVMSAEELKAITDEAHRVGKKVAVHAINDYDVRLAAAAGVDSIEHGYSLPDDAIKVMIEKNIFLVPTDHTPEYYMPDNISPEQLKPLIEQRKGFEAPSRERLSRAFKAGVRIAAGSDTYYGSSSKTRGQLSADMFRAYAESNMPPIEIIRAATINAATLIAGNSARFGSLEPGKYADIIAVEGNPLDDISKLEQVKFVMKNGTVFKR